MFAERTNWDLASNRLSEALSRHRASGKQLIDLTASNPTECGFAYDREATLAALSCPGALAYEPNPKGLAVARKAVAAHYTERGESVSADDIILTTSTSEAYSFVFRALCNPGDELLVPEPSYPLFGFLADIQDVTIKRYALLYDDGWQTDFQSLEQAIAARTRGVIVVNPNNPTGQFVKHEELKKLNDICSAREMAVIADEVFFDFALSVKQPPSFASNAAALTFTMSGLSKISGLPQMKLAWLITSGPNKLKQEALARLEVIADTFLSPSTPIQLATPVFLEQRHAFQRQLMNRVQTNLAELDDQLAAQKTCSRLKVEGGWFAVLRVPATRSDEDLAIELLTLKDVYVHPGHFYDFAGDGYLVVSLMTPEQNFAEGVRRALAML
jgi:aspartate/methionine/tyrosine aminotransferase